MSEILSEPRLREKGKSILGLPKSPIAIAQG